MVGSLKFCSQKYLELFPKPSKPLIPRLTVASLLLVLMMSSFPACACHRLSRSPMPGADVGILSIACINDVFFQDCLQNETEHAMTSEPEGNGPESVINKRSLSSMEGSVGNKRYAFSTEDSLRNRRAPSSTEETFRYKRSPVSPQDTDRNKRSPMSTKDTTRYMRSPVSTEDTNRNKRSPSSTEESVLNQRNTFSTDDSLKN